MSPSSSCFITALESITVPKTVKEALSHLGWPTAMQEGMVTLDHNGTWNLVPLPSSKKAMDCKWVFIVKVNSDGYAAQLKAHLIAKGYAHTYEVDCSGTFSSVVKIRYKESFPSWWPLRKGLYGATAWLCCSGGVGWG